MSVPACTQIVRTNKETVAPEANAYSEKPSLPSVYFPASDDSDHSTQKESPKRPVQAVHSPKLASGSLGCNMNLESLNTLGKNRLL